MSVEEFIEANIHKSTAELSLLLSKKPDFPRDYIINQIKGRKIAKSKFPFLLQINSIKFPNSRALEQASSSETAAFKTSLFSGKRAIDLTGGMGIDSYFFSKRFDVIDYVEANPELFEITKKNFTILEAENINSHCKKAEGFLRETKFYYDLIYIDPDRRAAKSKAFKIEDCEPKMTDLLPIINEKAENCLVKLSPMLDIKQALGEFKNCKTVYVIAVKNECRELLFQLKKDYSGEATIRTINLNSKTQQSFNFDFEHEQKIEVKLEVVGSYILDPNVAILKAGAFKTVSEIFNIAKLGINTHLYTSNSHVPNFPGRQFKVLKEVKLRKGELKQANVICKNFPLSPEQIKSKYKIKDGGKKFLIALTDMNNQKKVYLCELEI